MFSYRDKLSILSEPENISSLSMQLDGSGYPDKLKGDEISRFGRAAAIADVYDAMTSQRKYQRRYEPTEVLRKLFEWSEHFYDKHMIQQFIRCVGIYPVVTLVRMESGMLAVVLKHGEENLLQPELNNHRDLFVV